MKLCADCKQVEVKHPFVYCPTCGAARTANRLAEKSKRDSAARSDARRCACGCGKKPYGRSCYAKECAIRIRKEKKAAHNRKQTVEMVQVQVPKKRQPNKIVKTAEQVDRECRREESRLRAVLPTLNLELLALRNCRGAVAVIGV